MINKKDTNWCPFCCERAVKRCVNVGKNSKKYTKLKKNIIKRCVGQHNSNISKTLRTLSKALNQSGGAQFFHKCTMSDQFYPREVL